MNKSINKLFFLFLCLTLCLSFSLNVAADVIWEPYDNSFYEEHLGEYNIEERSYTANTEISVYEAPDDDRATGKIPAGSQFAIDIYWTAADGNVWGYVRTGDELGWARLSEMTVVYDYISFKEEHESEISVCDESFNLSTGIDIYAYPGSPTPVTAIDGSSIPENEQIQASEKYTAADGRVWYFCSYLYGNRNFWFTPTAAASATDITTADSVALDSTTVASVALDSTTIASNTIDSTTLDSDMVTEPTENPAEKETDMKTLALVLVVLLAVGTAVLIPVIMKRKKK